MNTKTKPNRKDTPQVHEWNLAVTMVKFGGGFASAIGHAYQTADKTNRKILADTFDPLFKSYEKFL